jgi:hypothetical protein
MLQNNELAASDADRDANNVAVLGSLPSSQLSYSDTDIRLVSRGTSRLSPSPDKALRKIPSGRIQKPRFRLPVEFDIALLVAEMRSQRLESPKERLPQPGVGLRPGTPIPRAEPNQRRRTNLRYIN